MVYHNFQHRDFTNCSVCGKHFGFRSDSVFCNVECQTRAAVLLEKRVRSNFVREPVRNVKFGARFRPF